jgi:hypothetical protein
MKPERLLMIFIMYILEVVNVLISSQKDLSILEIEKQDPHFKQIY